MENNMEKVVDLKETSGRYVLEESRDYHYIFDTKTFLDRLALILEAISDENGIIEIPQEEAKDFRDKFDKLEDTDGISTEELRLAIVDMLDLNPDMTIGEMFGFYKEEA